MATRTLVLVRHAAAEPWSSGGDRSRALSAAGVDQAARLGRLIHPLAPRVDCAMVSSARRARQTMAGLARSLAVGRTQVRDDLYLCAPDEALGSVRALDGSCAAAMVVGHEPTISAAAWMLAASQEERDLVAGGVPTATRSRSGSRGGGPIWPTGRAPWRRSTRPGGPAREAGAGPRATGPAAATVEWAGTCPKA